MKTLKEFQKLGGFQGIGALRRSSGAITVAMYLENELLQEKILEKLWLLQLNL